jgi:hypothetical protein
MGAKEKEVYEKTAFIRNIIKVWGQKIRGKGK